ncbi:hypothetical protein B6U90_05310 [Thermoplasmatales archaeon ex4484_6]|nr:MAG: hypothetical protein B6U90_05310 [Thermoplasmatales archaeon ex4484_6]
MDIPLIQAGEHFPSDLQDSDGDGRPDEFEVWQGLNEDENDVEWTFLVYCCGDDVPCGNRMGTILPEMWEFIEKLSWVGCTDNISIVVQFDGNDQLYGYHPDMFWNSIPNNVDKPHISETSTRRFLVGKDSTGWDPSMILDEDCANNTLIDLYDVTDWDPKGTGGSHNSTHWEANMADPLVLHEFISWGLDTFPSDNYCLYVDSHGDGITGFAYDYRPNEEPTTTIKDVLNLSDIRKVGDLLLDEEPQKNLDIVMLQSCLMGNIEFCHEFSRFCDYYVASENVMHITGNQDDVVLQSLDEDPQLSPARLAREFIDVEYIYSRDKVINPPWNIMDWDGRERLTFSSINCTQLRNSDLMEMASIFNQAVVDGVGLDKEWYFPALMGSLSAETTDCYTNDFNYTQIDYLEFLEYWKDVEGPDDGILPLIRETAGNISSLLWNEDIDSRSIEYEKHDLGFFKKTSGLSIYLPFAPCEWKNTSIYYRNSSFDEMTGWSEVIDLLHRNFEPSIDPIDRISTYPGIPVTTQFDVKDLNGDDVELSVISSDAPFEISVIEPFSISFNATEEQTGLYHATLRFDDGNGSFTNMVIEIEVLPFDRPVLVESVGNQTAYVGEEFILNVNVSDEDPDDIITVECEYPGAGECWMDEEWNLHIIPLEKDIGINNVRLEFSDNNGSLYILSFNLSVIWRNAPPEGPRHINITTRAGEKYSVEFGIEDPDGDNISIEHDGPVPDWMTIVFDSVLSITVRPTSGDTGVWDLSLLFKDPKGGMLEVLLTVNVEEALPPILLLPEVITLKERERLSFALNTDYTGNGTVRFEVNCGECDFLILEEASFRLLPVDGDHGSYDIEFETILVNGTTRTSNHTIIVEMNTSTLDVSIEILPDTGPYRVGDMVIIEVLYTGYSGTIEFSITIEVDGNVVSTEYGTEASHVITGGSVMKVIVDYGSMDPTIEPVIIEIGNDEGEGEEGIDTFLMIGIAAGFVIMFLAVLLGFILRKQPLDEESYVEE